MNRAGLQDFLAASDSALQGLYGRTVSYNSQEITSAVVYGPLNDGTLTNEGQVVKEAIRVRIPKADLPDKPTIGGTIRMDSKFWRIISVHSPEWETNWHIICGIW